jgi:uncharacterized protein YndB with AHSA1/START domain
MLNIVQQDLEQPKMSQNFVLETYIATTQDKLWQAITDGKVTPDYYFGARLDAELRRDGKFDYIFPDGSTMLSGKVIEIDPPNRLVSAFTPHWGSTPGRTTRVTYEIEAKGATCRLLLTHEGLTDEDGGIRQGWAKIVSGLKTVLETGGKLDLAAA